METKRVSTGTFAVDTTKNMCKMCYLFIGQVGLDKKIF